MRKLLELLKKGTSDTGKGIADVVDTGLSLISDKTRDSGDSFIKDKKGKRSFSSKRVLNFSGSGAIVSTGLYLVYSGGLSTHNLILIIVGIVYSLGMTYITMLSEKKVKQ